MTQWWLHRDAADFKYSRKTAANPNDLVDHSILLAKLQRYEIRSNALILVESFYMIACNMYALVII